MPGTSTNRSRRSRFRTLQTRLNLKKRVMQPRKDRKSQIPGSRPRSETSVPFTVTSSIRFEREGVARELAQRVEGGALFCIFLVAAPCRSVRLAADQRRDLEALRMIGALLVEQDIRGRLAELALGHLLEVALVVDPALTLNRRVDLRLDVSDDETPGRLHPAVEEDCA